MEAYLRDFTFPNDKVPCSVFHFGITPDGTISSTWLPESDFTREKPRETTPSNHVFHLDNALYYFFGANYLERYITTVQF